MKTNYTTGVLTGIFSVLLITIILDLNKIDSNDNYSFHDLNDTRAIIFNKVTGEIKYDTIRDKVPSQVQKVSLVGGQMQRVHLVGSDGKANRFGLPIQCYFGCD